jgi:Tol biopolymer transport system component
MPSLTSNLRAARLALWLGPGTLAAWPPSGLHAADIYHFDGPGKVCPQIVSLVERVGARVDWGVNNLIAYDQLDPKSGRFQVWVMRPDGSDAHCITRRNAMLGRKSVGNPAWHPSGNYLVLQVCDMEAPPWAVQQPEFYKRITGPGVGFNNDLWIVSTDGSHAAPLTRLREGQGVLHPHFSHNGEWLLWSELVSHNPQKWVMRLAKFRVDPDGPHLSDIRTLDPFDNSFYEPHDFSPDDQDILFSTTRKENDFRHLAIVRMNLLTEKTKYLTDPHLDEWNEHAHFSPDGSKIIWASSHGVDQQPEGKVTRNEFWIMNEDGTQRQRLTFFNEPGAPEFRDAFNIASDLSWSPDGKAFIGYLQCRPFGETGDNLTGSILRIALP